MDWIHCNTCSLQPGDKRERTFALTSCGHIYCDLCVEASTKEKCRVCGSQCNSVQLTAQMRPDVQHFFTDPGDVLKKALQIMDFQRGHRQRLTAYWRSMITKELAAYEEITKLRKKILELEGKVSHLKSALCESERRRAAGVPGNITMTPTIQKQFPSASFKSPTWMANSPGHPVTSPTQGQVCTPQSQTNSQKTPPYPYSQQQQHRQLANMSQLRASQTLQQQHSSPAKADSWVTPNRLTLKKTSPSQQSQSAVSPISPASQGHPANWNISPGMRSVTQTSPLSNGPPRRISPYLPMRTGQPTSASQGASLSSKERFPYLASQSRK